MTWRVLRTPSLRRRKVMQVACYCPNSWFVISRQRSLASFRRSGAKHSPPASALAKSVVPDHKSTLDISTQIYGLNVLLIFRFRTISVYDFWCRFWLFRAFPRLIHYFASPVVHFNVIFSTFSFVNTFLLMIFVVCFLNLITRWLNLMTRVEYFASCRFVFYIQIYVVCSNDTWFIHLFLFI